MTPRNLAHVSKWRRRANVPSLALIPARDEMSVPRPVVQAVREIRQDIDEQTTSVALVPARPSSSVYSTTMAVDMIEEVVFHVWVGNSPEQHVYTNATPRTVNGFAEHLQRAEFCLHTYHMKAFTADQCFDAMFQQADVSLRQVHACRTSDIDRVKRVRRFTPKQEEEEEEEEL